MSDQVGNQNVGFFMMRLNQYQNKIVLPREAARGLIRVFTVCFQLASFECITSYDRASYISLNFRAYTVKLLGVRKFRDQLRLLPGTIVKFQSRR